jgi:enoyl-CoA hydratase/carnithine racemase
MSTSTPSAKAAPLPVEIDADKIAVLTIEPNQGPMVILDLALIQRLEVTFKQVRAAAPAGLVLASGSGRVFIAGADLKAIDAMTVTELEGYLRYGQEVFGLLCTMPCPTVAAINGAALGGGLELAMHCDGLVAAPPSPGKDGAVKPYPIGLPEAGLKICPGWGGTNLLPARMDPADAIRRTCTGRTMTIDEAVSAKLVDALAETPTELLKTCKAWLKTAVTIPGKRRDGEPLRWIGRDGVRNATLAAYSRLIDELGGEDPGKACLRAVAAGLESGWAAALKVEREELNRLRLAPAGKGAIGAFLSKSR